MRAINDTSQKLVKRHPGDLASLPQRVRVETKPGQGVPAHITPLCLPLHALELMPMQRAWMWMWMWMWTPAWALSLSCLRQRDPTASPKRVSRGLG